MKKRVCFAVSFVLLAAVSAAAQSLTGNWTLTFDKRNETPVSLVLKQDGAYLSGTYGGLKVRGLFISESNFFRFEVFVDGDRRNRDVHEGTFFEGNNKIFGKLRFRDTSVREQLDWKWTAVREK
jgi:hypothetical protein